MEVSPARGKPQGAVHNGLRLPVEKAQFRLVSPQTLKVCPGSNRRTRKASMNWSKKVTSSRLALWRGERREKNKKTTKSTTPRAPEKKFPLKILRRSK